MTDSDVIRHPGMVVDVVKYHEPFRREALRCLIKNR
jgi:hypothetical protein